MADIKGRLIEAINGKTPQHKVEGQQVFEATEGLNGQLNTRDKDVLAKLAEVEAKIQATNDRLNQTLDTQLTGSNVEQTLDNTLPEKAALIGVSDGEKIQAMTGAKEVGLLARAVRSSPTGTPYQTNINSRGVIIFLRIYSKPAGETLTLQFNSYDAWIGNTKAFVSIPGINSVGTIGIVIYPGIIEKEQANSFYFRNFVLPKTWMVYIAPTTGDWDYSISAHYLN